MSCRAQAAHVLAAIISQRGSLSNLLPEALDKTDQNDRALLQELCYGSLRHYFSLRALLESFLEKPLKEKDVDVFAILLLGAYQLEHMRTPAYAAINSSVEAATEINKPWAKGLVNAVLRNIQRRCDKPESAGTHTRATDETTFEHPAWLIEKIRASWPVQADDILHINNTRAPMTLRVNAQQVARDEYHKQLMLAQIGAKPGSLSPQALVLDSPVDVDSLPGFSEGRASVQDEAAQLSAPLLQLSTGLHVLDACAAPGGKACHLLETQPGLRLVALDINEQRCALIRENLQRLKLSAQVIAGDACHPEAWWESNCHGVLFDRILVDAPCSATGVIRHHPDIKLLRQPGDIASLAHTQLQILQALWPLLSDNGVLLYVTCSILPQENDGVIAKFLACTSDAQLDRMNTGWGITTTAGIQLLPQQDGHDGFYFCRIRKASG